MSVSILCFSLLYRFMDSVFVLLCFCRCIGLWNIVYVGRWSERGGDIVPAVICVSVRVVSVMSIIVAVLWYGSYLVGVVIVVCRLFSVRNMKNACVGLSRFMFRSPCIVIVVFGCFVWI